MKMLPTTWKTVATAILACATLTTVAHAQTADALLEVLVRKGILTEQEAEDIRTDLSREFREASKVHAPNKDILKMELYGDLRGRFDGIYPGNDSLEERARFRYRLRFGTTVTYRESFEVGFRLASSESPSGFTGEGDPISQNTTLGNNGSKKPVYIDAAYGRWIALNPANPHQSPNWYGDVTIGKMDNPFVYSPLVFDGDYTPEGFGSHWAYSNTDKTRALSLNLGGFMLDEMSASSHDPFFYGAQLRYDATWTELNTFPLIKTSSGVGFLNIAHNESLGNSDVPNVGSGNTRLPNGSLAENINPITADASLTYTLERFPFYTGNFPITVGGDYLYNPAAQSDNQAFSAGITFGKAGRKHTWQLAYTYRFLESDAWYEELVDSDFGASYQTALQYSDKKAGYSSGTNTKGHVIKASYSPYDALTFSGSFVMAELIDDPHVGASNSDTLRVFIDANWKF